MRRQGPSDGDRRMKCDVCVENAAPKASATASLADSQLKLQFRSTMEGDSGQADLDKLNLFFPGEVVQAIQESLHPIDDFAGGDATCEPRHGHTRSGNVVRSLAVSDQDGRTSLLHAQEAIAELFSRFQDIKVYIHTPLYVHVCVCHSPRALSTRVRPAIVSIILPV
ncbi:hypothetical protein GWK47_031716 [Chionoecetes opilio]|uniref:Uncharacterized protein n=1 Tax=Chionoecetes opilio TaxID=41210 RepID=A0A8J4YKB2_CHIOP|nr:hypothetical protein GWK47_031716 [Chionoecetes opilio]